MQDCIIDYAVDDRPGAIISTVARITPLFRESGILRIDLSRCPHRGAHGIALLGSAMVDLRAKQRLPELILPSDLRVRACVEALGVLQLIDPALTGQTSSAISIWTIERTGFLDPDPIIRLIGEHASLSDEREEYLRICISEVLQNVEDHAKSPQGAVMAANFLPRVNEIRIGIVDAGIGIASSLALRYPDLSDVRDALDRVARGYFSAKSRPNNMGVGISNLCSIVTRELRGELLILSENGFAIGRPGFPLRIDRMQCRFTGTGVFMAIPIA